MEMVAVTTETTVSGSYSFSFSVEDLATTMAADAVTTVATTAVADANLRFTCKAAASVAALHYISIYMNGLYAA